MPKPYPITHPRPGQTKPLPLTVDGTTKEDTLQGDGPLAPFYVFDQNNQANVLGPFKSRKDAVVAARAFAKQHGLEVAE